MLRGRGIISTNRFAWLDADDTVFFESPDDLHSFLQDGLALLDEWRANLRDESTTPYGGRVESPTLNPEEG